MKSGVAGTLLLSMLIVTIWWMETAVKQQNAGPGMVSVPWGRWDAIKKARLTRPGEYLVFLVEVIHAEVN